MNTTSPMHPEDRKALREWIALRYSRELRELREIVPYRPALGARWLAG